MKSRQTRFDHSAFKTKDFFGGSFSTCRSFRRARPISTKQSMHLVLKSSLAKGRFSFRYGSNAKRIDSAVVNTCRKYGVKLIRHSNNFNHIHLDAKFPSRELFKRFIRSLSGQIAMIASGARKGRRLGDLVGRQNFWDFRPFSRVVRGRRGYTTANDYVELNKLEADGVISKRESRLRGLTPAEWELVRSPS